MKAIFVCVGIGSALAAIVGFGLYHGQNQHTSVAPWDYPDHPNVHPIAHQGARIGLPKYIVVAHHNEVTTPEGIKVRLVAISKGNSYNREHWWSPSGGPILDDLSQSQPEIPDQAEVTDGPVRIMKFEISSDEPTKFGQVSTIGYIPDQARKGLTSAEEQFHGWDFSQTQMLGKFPAQKEARLYVDDLSASRYMFGIASGDWTTVDKVKSELSATPDVGDVAAKGPWGTAIVTHSMFAKPKPRQNDRLGAGLPSRPTPNHFK